MALITTSTILRNTWGIWILQGDVRVYMDTEFTTQTNPFRLHCFKFLYNSECDGYGTRNKDRGGLNVSRQKKKGTWNLHVVIYCKEYCIWICWIPSILFEYSCSIGNCSSVPWAITCLFLMFQWPWHLWVFTNAFCKGTQSECEITVMLSIYPSSALTFNTPR